MNKFISLVEKPKPEEPPVPPPSTLDDVVNAIKDLQYQLTEVKASPRPTPPPTA
jgi:hypothetical protein